MTALHYNVAASNWWLVTQVTASCDLSKSIRRDGVERGSFNEQWRDGVERGSFNQHKRSSFSKSGQREKEKRFTRAQTDLKLPR